MSLITNLLAVVLFIGNCLSQWTPSPGSVLPVPCYSIAIGAWNQTIHILGGFGSTYQPLHHLFEYDVLHDTFTHYDSAMPSNVLGYGAFYTQIDNILYIKYSAKNSMHVYNMKSKIFSSDSISTPNECSSVAGWCRACLASTSHQIFVVGGDDTTKILDTVYMLDLTTNQWLHNIASMQNRRVDFSCIINPNTGKLYSIGGVTTQGKYTSNVETINTNQITTNTWEHVGYLAIAIAYTTAVIHRNVIFVIGGAYVQNFEWIYTDNVQTINTLSNEISSLEDSLLYSIASAAAIIVDDILYVFGGENSHGVVNTWMKYELLKPSTMPTSSPSYDPSDAATATPTASNVTATAKPSNTAFEYRSTTTSFPNTTASIQSTTVPSVKPSHTPFEYRETAIYENTNVSFASFVSNDRSIATPSNTSSDLFLDPQQNIDDDHNIIIICVLLIIICVLLIGVCVLIIAIIRNRRNKKRVIINDNNMMQKEIVNKLPMQQNIVLQHGEGIVSPLYNMEGLKPVDGEIAATVSSKEDNVKDATTRGIAIDTNDMYADGAADA